MATTLWSLIGLRLVLLVLIIGLWAERYRLQSLQVLHRHTPLLKLLLHLLRCRHRRTIAKLLFVLGLGDCERWNICLLLHWLSRRPDLR